MKNALIFATLLFAATLCTAQDVSLAVTSSFNELNDRIDQIINRSLPEAPITEEAAAPQTSSSRELPATRAGSALPNVPRLQTPQQQKPLDPQFDYLYWAGLFCGAGGSVSSIANSPVLNCGVGISLFPATFIEVGGMGTANQHSPAGYFSFDGKIPLDKRKRLSIPTAILGYTRKFQTANALDYGLAFDTPALRGGKSSGESFLRIELRDYYAFETPNQHNVILRIGWMAGMPD